MAIGQAPRPGMDRQGIARGPPPGWGSGDRARAATECDRAAGSRPWRPHTPVSLRRPRQDRGDKAAAAEVRWSGSDARTTSGRPPPSRRPTIRCSSTCRPAVAPRSALRGRRSADAGPRRPPRPDRKDLEDEPPPALLGRPRHVNLAQPRSPRDQHQRQRGNERPVAGSGRLQLPKRPLGGVRSAWTPLRIPKPPP